MSEYTFADLEHFLFEHCYKQFEIKDILVGSWRKEGDPEYQMIKYNIFEDQNLIDDRTGKRYIAKGERLNTYTGDEELIDDESKFYNLRIIEHYWKINMKLKSEGYEGHTTLSSNVESALIKLIGKKKKPPAIKRHNFFSCCPKYRIGISEGEVIKMEEFLKNNLTEKYFKKVRWCIESGKHKNSPNLHFHFLGLFNPNGSKNFRKRILFDAWNKVYPENPLEWKNNNGNRGIHVYACCTQILVDDKLKYLMNDSKGTHENFIDLNKSGGFGFV